MRPPPLTRRRQTWLLRVGLVRHDPSLGQCPVRRFGRHRALLSRGAVRRPDPRAGRRRSQFLLPQGPCRLDPRPWRLRRWRSRRTFRRPACPGRRRPSSPGTICPWWWDLGRVVVAQGNPVERVQRVLKRDRWSWISPRRSWLHSLQRGERPRWIWTWATSTCQCPETSQERTLLEVPTPPAVSILPTHRQRAVRTGWKPICRSGEQGPNHHANRPIPRGTWTCRAWLAGIGQRRATQASTCLLLSFVGSAVKRWPSSKPSCPA